jgi:hypothetical protein
MAADQSPVEAAISSSVGFHLWVANAHTRPYGSLTLADPVAPEHVRDLD